MQVKGINLLQYKEHCNNTRNYKYIHTKLTIHFSPIEEACKKSKHYFHNVIYFISKG